ncbi:sarcosine oxidase [Beauveria bassiana ARSEF 2860]|uniref:Sarcosine oxidase n=1 Tax=Beauveria bassiana (strain ARSEF 2860) TaxID=655819 RepID=J4UG70_BEAB2|nr:sarcosine oxidase [Beauveria bassiana ARSEF 2860]EJP61737.1 sarcosine oxidase [Beauveria bassiana ARSEF 2860]
MPDQRNKTIFIIGGGAFGLSTALYLAEAGYQDVTVLERDLQIPPRYSAANDLNKIVRAEYEDSFYTELTLKAIDAWKTPLFAPHFHQTGFLHCVSPAASTKAVQTLERFRQAAMSSEHLRPHVVPIENGECARAAVASLRDCLMPGWRGYFNRYDGYAHSADALACVYKKIRELGVKVLLGPDGHVEEIVYRTVKGTRVATGVRTASTEHLPAELVIVAAGAYASTLVPRIGRQIVAKSWSIAHVQLTETEAAALAGIPVTYARDFGFLFEPDRKTKLLKLCPMGGGYINTNPTTGVSVPPTNLGCSNFMPPEDERKVRQLLADVFPALANRPLVKKQLCWFADSSDSDFVIDYVPDTSSSVMILSGDSGHGFKMFPIFGSWVLDLLESDSQTQTIGRWKWKSESGGAGGKDDISWRVGDVREFEEVAPIKERL